MSIGRFLLTGIVLVMVAVAQAQQPVLTEYFLDKDPGYGKARSASSNQVGENQMTLDLSDAAPGVHLLSVRTQDSEGKWSTTMSRPLFFDRLQDITYIEYYIDTDPGVGRGTPVTLPDINYKAHLDFGFQISTTGLALGEHKLFVRAKDALGQWTDVENRKFTIVESHSEEPEVKGDLARLEYFFDNDPGYGKGFPLRQARTGENTYEMSFESVSAGYHLLSIRAQDEDGRWSSTMSRPLYVINPLKVTAVEYYIDIDPGEGKAVEVSMPADISEAFAFEVPTSQLKSGEHHLAVRAKGQDGIWTLVSSQTFTVGALAGDTNGDGVVNVADIVMLIKMSGDNPASEADIQMILKMIMQKE